MTMSEKNSIHPAMILSAGTKVVTRVDAIACDGGTVLPRGATAVVVRSPGEEGGVYGVRFPDGAEGTFGRAELAVLKEYQKGELMTPAGGVEGCDLYQYLIYRCVVGSQAYGLAHAESDVDRRGIYLPPAELHWSLYGVPEQLENQATEECYWELQKFLNLALKANPNILECLYTPLVEMVTPLGQELLEMREVFLSRLVYQTYNGYVLSQFKKLEQDLRARGAIKWKHAMHLIRLLLSGITVLREGFVPVELGSHRDRLLAIRQGEMSWEAINGWRLELHKEFEEAFTATTLPECPDYERANRYLIEARRSMVRSK